MSPKYTSKFAKLKKEALNKKTKETKEINTVVDMPKKIKNKLENYNVDHISKSFKANPQALEHTLNNLSGPGWLLLKEHFRQAMEDKEHSFLPRFTEKMKKKNDLYSETKDIHKNAQSQHHLSKILSQEKLGGSFYNSVFNGLKSIFKFGSKIISKAPSIKTLVDKSNSYMRYIVPVAEAVDAGYKIVKGKDLGLSNITNKANEFLDSNIVKNLVKDKEPEKKEEEEEKKEVSE